MVARVSANDDTAVMRSTTRTARIGVAVLGLAVFAAGCALCAAPPPISGATDAVPSQSNRSAALANGIVRHPTGELREATLVRVVDGDTIRVVVNGAEERVRYIGINTPERYPGGPQTPAPFADAATAANVALLGTSRLILEQDISERDRFGRLLRNIWLEREGAWVFVNLRLVADGFARVSTFPPDVKYVDLLRDAERAARESHLGLWGPGSG